MQDFKNLRVWQAGHALRLKLYATSKGFPREERYGLTAQLRDAGGSICRTLAEGCGRRSRAELAHFVEYSMGSAAEVEDCLIQARDLHYVTTADFEQLNHELLSVRRMLHSLHAQLQKAIREKEKGTR